MFHCSRDAFQTVRIARVQTLMPANDLMAQFDLLQRQLAQPWEPTGRPDPGRPLEAENTVVVVNSLSMESDLPQAALRAYEERFLFMLFLLRQPMIRIIYVTSEEIAPDIVDNYLHICPGVIFGNARQ